MSMILLANVHHMLHFLAFFFVGIETMVFGVLQRLYASLMCIVLCVRCVHSLTHFLTQSHIHLYLCAFTLHVIPSVFMSRIA